MQNSFFKEMPKFKTPEEELNYLRAHVVKREQELIDTGHFEHAEENAVKNVIAEYKEIPIEQALHKDIIFKKTICYFCFNFKK